MPGLTILGGTGLIGSHLARQATEQGRDVRVFGRDLESLWSDTHGTIIYSIGLTADFRQRPLDAVDAHVCLLRRILSEVDYDRLIYLSSTRVYTGAEVACEDAGLATRTDRLDDLYNLSKMMGESLCISAGRPRDCVARLSNVYGSSVPAKNFLDSVIADALKDGHVTLQTSAASAKDFVHVQDVCAALLAIADVGEERIYNVAAGQNTSNDEIIGILAEVTGCSYDYTPDAPTWAFPEISVERLRSLLHFPTRTLASDLPGIIEQRLG